MSKHRRLEIRRPATKFAKLRKKIKKRKAQGIRLENTRGWRRTRAGF